MNYILRLFLSIILPVSFSSELFAQQTLIHYLSGTDKDHTVQWDFFCTKGQNSGQWTKIAVPSNWELQGFGYYEYGTQKEKHDEQGLYKHSFDAPAAWKGKKLILVFEGVMTDTEVKINGKSAGDIHQGGFYQFKYDITGLINYGEKNLLEVTVSKKSANKSVDRAERGGDFWALSGIYRPVYLQVLPSSYIERTAINAKADGTFSVDVFASNRLAGQTVEVQLLDEKNKIVGAPLKANANDSVRLQSRYANIKIWNAEKPNLYYAVIQLRHGNKIVHSIKQRFGFRTVEMRPMDGFYVNGVKVIMKGVNRHSFWPSSGRTLSRAIHLQDIAMMKDMNMNAVRMSHYPPDQEFLDLCDSIGLFVIDEVTGWQAAYDTVAGRKLVKEMVLRDVNHPSVVIWSNGNEGGWNRALDGDYHWYDPQKRFVMHPWERFNGTDTKHYPDFNYVSNAVLYGKDIFYPTEFMHGLYDGGHGAALDDFWNEMLKHPYFAGGFLWVLSDEGIVRTDQGGRIDTYGTSAPDGIVGPYREKEASYYTIKEIWSPVVVHTKTIPGNFNSKLEIENRFHFTNLKECRFEYKFVALPHAFDTIINGNVIRKGSLTSPSLSPGEKGFLQIPLPDENADVLYLTAIDPKGMEIFTWSWSLKPPASHARMKRVGVSSRVKRENGKFVVLDDAGEFVFDTTSGFLEKVIIKGKEISFSHGPSLTYFKHVLTSFHHYEENGELIIEPRYEREKNNYFQPKWIFSAGRLPRLEYAYEIKEPVDYAGITFNYPEEKIEGMRWMGRGPYRVWKNRLKGMQFGVWEKKYNNTVTGESWDYPEFKGWHSDIHWVRIKSKERDFAIYTATESLFLQMMKPQRPKDAYNEFNNPPFPDASIGFMHSISAIGTKFQPAEVMGPQSQKNMQMNYGPVKGVLLFDFR